MKRHGVARLLGSRVAQSLTRFGSFGVKLSGCEAAFSRVSAAHVEVWLPRFTHMTGILGNGIIHSVIEGVCFPTECHNS
jgi:hypothetical protein